MHHLQNRRTSYNNAMRFDLLELKLESLWLEFCALLIFRFIVEIVRPIQLSINILLITPFPRCLVHTLQSKLTAISPEYQAGISDQHVGLLFLRLGVVMLRSRLVTSQIFMYQYLSLPICSPCFVSKNTTHSRDIIRHPSCITLIPHISKHF